MMRTFGINALIGVVGFVFLVLTVFIIPLFILWASSLVTLAVLYDTRSK